MNTFATRRLLRQTGLVTLLAGALTASLHMPAQAADVNKGIEQALAAAQESKKGIMVYTGGQAIGGAVTKIEAGQWVELRNQQYGRIVVRMDRIDGIAMP
jgi:putative heme degradation protein